MGHLKCALVVAGIIAGVNLLNNMSGGIISGFGTTLTTTL